MAGLENILLQHPFFRAWRRSSAWRCPAVPATRASRRGNACFAKARLQTSSFCCARAALRSRCIPPDSRRSCCSLWRGEIAGVSWLVAPYRWAFDGRALERVHALGIDARCLRAKCEADHDLGYELLKRFLALSIRRLHDTRLQHLDVYGQPGDMSAAALDAMVPTPSRVVGLTREVGGLAHRGSRPGGRRDSGLPARPIQHALRLRPRRGGDQPER